MRIRDTRLWAVFVALAFVVLWFVGVGAAYAAPVQEPLPEPSPPVPSEAAQTVGVAGWCLVGIGFLGVAVAVVLESRPKRRRRTVRRASPVRAPSHVTRSVYSPPPARRYYRNVERRF